VGRGVVGALAVDVGAQLLHDGGGRQVVEDEHVVHAPQRCHHLGALLLGDDGAAGALEGAHGGVAVDPDDQDVTEGRGCLEAADVPGVKHVEAAVRPYHGATPLPHPLARLQHASERGDMTGASPNYPQAQPPAPLMEPLAPIRGLWAWNLILGQIVQRLGAYFALGTADKS